MQIITGKYRARKLIGVDSTDTRPTLARVKESVFNLIFDKIEGKVVLDLFAGSGAYGAECISRGAKEVFFVDQTEKAIKTIKTNTQKMTEKFEVIKSSFLDALSSFEKRNLKFDVVFLDPPYTVSKESNCFIEYNPTLFSIEDQYRLGELIDHINEVGAYYILTNAAHETIQRIFQGKGRVN